MGIGHIPEDGGTNTALCSTIRSRTTWCSGATLSGVHRQGGLPAPQEHPHAYAEKLIDQYDVRSVGPDHHCPQHVRRQPAEGHRRREIDKDPELLVAVQPTRGLDVSAIEYIHRQLVAQPAKSRQSLLVSLELDEVMDVPDRILVMYPGEIVELDPKKDPQEAGPTLHGRREEMR